MDNQMTRSLVDVGLFKSGKATVMVDGQYGSTGKGLLASKLATLISHVDVVVSNAGPNSGHTFYHEDEKHVLMQMPSFAVKKKLLGDRVSTWLSHGAIIDQKILAQEIEKYDMLPHVSPWASIANPKGEKGLSEAIGSTGKGTGAGLASKIMRHVDAVAHNALVYKEVMRTTPIVEGSTIFMEISQGYSLGLNAGFYPYCTSRDCHVMQGMNDAGLHPNRYGGSIMSVRTFPIRVGGNSGPCYPDQEEIDWSMLNIEPETTTVTGKQRRIFTWSASQFRDALLANQPEMIFVNFMNYLPQEEWDSFIHQKVYAPAVRYLNKVPLIWLGTGPKDEDIIEWRKT